MWYSILGFGIIALLAVWELWICEGAHLGRRLVVWLYDLTASRYERIKKFDPQWERHFLGTPLAHSLASLRGARLLDVGAGTGRVARALFQSPLFDGLLVNLEASAGMISRGRQLVGRGQGAWIRAWEIPLPFQDDIFDRVLSLEMLEFTPKPSRTLDELVRVLRPGGWLIITNRVGWQAPLILGRTFTRSQFEAELARSGLTEAQIYPWQHDYDLAWARKPYPASQSVRSHGDPL